MGRHRPDPRGHARILVAAFAVVLGLALLIVGAIALFGALNSSSGPSASPSATVSSQPKTQPTSSNNEVAPDPNAHAVVIEALGPTTSVIVATTDNSKVYLQGHLNPGESRVYDDPGLVVTVDPAQNVNVYIHGRLVSKGKSGKQSFSE